MRRIFLLTGAIIISALLFACASKSVSTGKPGLSEALLKESKTTEKEPWEIEWQKTMSEAKREGRLVIYTGIDPHTRIDIGTAFKNKFDLDIEWTVGRGGELGTKIVTERKNGLYLGDLYIGGGTTGLTVLKPAGVLQALEPLFLLPEVKEPRNWWQNKLPFSDKDRTVLHFLLYPGSQLSINTSLVKPREIVSYYDLLEPKWKGKIIMEDPTVSGSIGRWARITGDFMPSLGWEYHRKLAKQEPFFSRDQRLLSEWLARGKYPVGIVPDTGVREFIKLGAPLAFITPKEGVYLATGFGNLASFNKAPHPDAARIFANWLLSKEGQLLVSKSQGKQSARVDISTSHLDPITTGGTREDLLKETGNILFPDEEYYEEIREKALAQINEIWSHLVK